MSNEVRTLHEPFAKFLRQRGIEFIRARSDRESTIEKGWVDFSVLHPRHAPLLIEFKTKEGRETPEQAQVRERLTGKGFKCFVVRDLTTAIELVDAWWNAPERPLAAPPARQKPTIRQWGSKGDWVCAGDAPIRRVAISDLQTYERGPLLIET